MVKGPYTVAVIHEVAVVGHRLQNIMLYCGTHLYTSGLLSESMLGYRYPRIAITFCVNEYSQ